MQKLAVAFAALAVVGFIAAGPITSVAKPEKPSPTRLDPYKTFKFRLEIAGRTVAGMNSVSVPANAATIRRSGGDPSTTRKAPGRIKFEPITLERGLTQDSDFAAWASSGPKSQGRIRRDVKIVTVDDKGRPVAAYTARRAWVSEYQGKGDAKDGAGLAITHMTLENEGWERNTN